MKIGEESDGIYRNFFFQNEETETVNGKIQGVKEEEIINLSGVVKKDNMIGTIGSWGPYFRISFEMMIKSFGADKMTNILSFKGNGATSNCCEIGDRVPALFMENKDKHGHPSLFFAHSLSGNGNYFYRRWIDLQQFKSPNYMELNKWYKIIIEQKKELHDGKVRFLHFI